MTGSDGFLFVAMGATTGAVTVQNVEFTNLDQDGVQITNDGSGTITSVMKKSNFHDADTTSGDGNTTVFLSQAGSGDHNFTIGGATAAEGNTFTNLGRLGVLAGVVQVNVNGAGSAGAQVNGTIQHNTINGSTGRRGIMFLAEASGGAQGGHTVSILDNTVSKTFHGSIYAIFSSLNNSDNFGNSLTVSRNNVNTTVGNSGGDSASAIEIEYAVGAGSSGSDIASTIMLEDNIAVNNTTSGLGDTIEIVNRADVVGATGDDERHRLGQHSDQQCWRHQLGVRDSQLCVGRRHADDDARPQCGQQRGQPQQRFPRARPISPTTPAQRLTTSKAWRRERRPQRRWTHSSPRATTGRSR